MPKLSNYGRDILSDEVGRLDKWIEETEKDLYVAKTQVASLCHQLDEYRQDRIDLQRFLTEVLDEEE